MKKTKSYILALAVGTVLSALSAVGGQQQGKAEEQPKTPAEANMVGKVFEVKYADAGRIADLIRVFPVGAVHPDRVLGVVSVRGDAATLAAVGEAIKKLDVPPQPRKSIDLTAYLLVASKQSSDGTGVPSELQDVATQLKGALGFQHYRLVDSLLLRTTDGSGGHLVGVVPWNTGDAQKAKYDFSIDRAQLESEGTTSTQPLVADNQAGRSPVFVHGLNLSIDFSGPQLPGLGSNLSRINTDVELREGQKVVVGKTAFDSPDSALILVLTAKSN